MQPPTNQLNLEGDEYLFESFLNYRDSLYLARTLDSLLKLKKSLRHNRKVDQTLTDYASSCIRMIFPDTKIPGWSEEEFLKLRQSEVENKSLSEEEFLEKIEKDSEEIRLKIESGEIDIFDDSPQYVSFGEAKSFFDNSLSTLKEKILPACNDSQSLLESITKKVLTLLDMPEEKSNFEEQKDYKAFLNLWDTARMFHEGEPPFKIRFSKQVAEQLGIDPIMEGINNSSMRPIKQASYEAKKLKASLKICLKSKFLPKELADLSKILFSKIDFVEE